MFDKNNICRHAGGEDRGYIVCCYGYPKLVECECCGADSCEWYSKLKKYTITSKAEDTTECQMTLDDEQLETVISVFKELDKNRETNYCPWYEIEDEDGNMIYETECI